MDSRKTEKLTGEIFRIFALWTRVIKFFRIKTIKNTWSK